MHEKSARKQQHYHIYNIRNPQTHERRSHQQHALQIIDKVPDSRTNPCIVYIDPIDVRCTQAASSAGIWDAASAFADAHSLSIRERQRVNRIDVIAHMHILQRAYDFEYKPTNCGLEHILKLNSIAPARRSSALAALRTLSEKHSLCPAILIEPTRTMNTVCQCAVTSSMQRICVCARVYYVGM